MWFDGFQNVGAYISGADETGEYGGWITLGFYVGAAVFAALENGGIAWQLKGGDESAAAAFRFQSFEYAGVYSKLTVDFNPRHQTGVVF